MDHDLRYDAHVTDPREATQHDLPAVPGGSGKDCTVWTETIEQRLARLEAAVDRLANAMQVMLLRRDKE